jgi:predicted ATPase
VVISQATRRLVGGVFELDDLGPRRLKGFAEPLAAWRVAGESRSEGRFEARQTAGLTPLVGREAEIALLLRRWQQAKDGEGHVVLLSGEPGIGKSRLVRGLRARLADEPHVRLLYQCSPHHTTSPLHPLIEQLERAAGFERDEPPAARLAKLETLLARGTNRLDHAVPLVATLLGIITGERYPAVDLTPQRQKQLTLAALVEQLDGLAADQPVLLTYEDVHWIDPTTQELLGLTIELIQRLPVLAIITCRPEFRPPWPAQPHVSALALSRLGRREGSAMVAQVSQDKAMPDEVAAQIVAKTDGVPLFVEELTKTVLESGLLKDAGDHYELAGPLPPFAIPATLHDSLLARLDRLAAVKEIAQIGAALGREFSHVLLAAVADRPEGELQTALDQLVSSELVFCRGGPPQATYTFKHALVQDVAYGTLLKSRRQNLHARIAHVLEEQFPEIAEAEPELLAHHATEAALVERAVHYWREAGWQAIARSAMAEAVVQLSRALSLLANLPAGTDRDHQELDLQIALEGAFVSTKGFASPEAGSAYLRARELSRQAAEAPQVLAILSGLIQFHLNRAELDAADKAAREQLRLAERYQDKAAQVTGQRVIGNILVFSGKFVPALKYLEQALALYDPVQRGSPVFLPYADSRVACLNFIAWSLLYLGYPNKGLVRSHESLAAAHELRPYTLTFALHVSCLFNQVRGDLRIVQEQSRTLMSLATEHGIPHWVATGTIFHGWALTAQGELDAGIAQMRQGLAAKQATGAQLKVPYYLGLLAAAYTQAGNAAEALGLLTVALTRVDETGERWFEPELHRLGGQALLLADRPTEAEASFRKALSVAQAQGARLWELRGATSLARLWAEQGRRHEARHLLAPVYGWFTEGFDTADLKEAKGLLDELA